MTPIEHSFSFTHVPPGLKRGRMAVNAVFSNHSLVLSRKHAYPAGIYRILGGGINPDEPEDLAAAREFAEETGLRLPPAAFTHWSTHRFTLDESSTSQQYVFVVDVFSIEAYINQLAAADDVDELKAFNKDEASAVTLAMKRLPTALVQPDPALPAFRWSDWGTVFGAVHDFVLERWPS